MATEHPTENDDEPQTTAKSAEDRKAAAALSNLDARDDSDVSASARPQVDQDAVKSAMSGVGPEGGTRAADAKKEQATKKVKVDAADVALLVAELEMSKARATDLLKAHEGDAVRAMKAFVEPAF